MEPEYDGGGLFLRCLWKGGGGLVACADRKGWGPYGCAALERWRGYTPVGTSHDVTTQKVGRVPPVGTTRHVPKNYRGVVMIGNPGGALRMTCRKNRGES